MRVYADSSFLLRLVTGESGADRAVATYRGMGRPIPFLFALAHAGGGERGSTASVP